jgi:hypothetical protein
VQPPAPIHTGRWLWIGLAGLVAAVGIGVGVRYATSSASDDPWSPSHATPRDTQPVVTTTTTNMTDGDRKLVGDFVSVFGRAIEHGPTKPGAPVTESDKALMRDMVGLFGEAMTRAASAPAAGSGDPWR